MPVTMSPTPRQLSKQRCRSCSSGARGSRARKPSGAASVARRDAVTRANAGSRPRGGVGEPFEALAHGLEGLGRSADPMALRQVRGRVVRQPHLAPIVLPGEGLHGQVDADRLVAQHQGGADARVPEDEQRRRPHGPAEGVRLGRVIETRDDLGAGVLQRGLQPIERLIHRVRAPLTDETAVSKCMLRPRRPPSQAWRAFLKNHAKDLIALDFFTVPTATFRVLFVLVVLSHDRRRLVHFNVTEHPTAEWTARQLLEACGLEESPRYLIRDRDKVYGERFSRQARMLDIREAVITPRSPWQNAYAERVIGSIRRECLDHVVVIGERHLRGILSNYVDYYNETRTHLALAKDPPEPRSAQAPSQGRVVEVPRVGGLHHEYRRRAA